MPDEIKEAILKVCTFCKNNENYWISECEDTLVYIGCPVARLWEDYQENNKEE